MTLVLLRGASSSSHITDIPYRVSVSLDKPAIPRSFGASPAPVKIVLGMVGIILALALLARIPGLGYLNGAIRDFCDRNNIEIYDKLAYRYR